MKFTHIVFMAAAISFASCNSNEPANSEGQDQELPEGNEAAEDNHEGHNHDSEAPADDSKGVANTWKGTYQAMAECPICDGVTKEITLNEGMTYMQVTKHKGTHIGNVAESGRFTWADENEQVLIISVGTDAEIQYDVEGDELIGLNKAGEKREGDGYGLYTLTKLEEIEPIYGKTWVLKAIDGQAIESSQERDGAIVLFSKEGTISGSASCNDFKGAYKVSADGGIAFGPIAATKKLCGDMSVEDRFLEGIGQVNKYVVHGAIMTLHVDADAAKLKFELAK